jgi:hypothetical protein
MDLKHWNITLSHISDIADWFPFVVFALLPKIKRKEYELMGAYLLLNGALKTYTLVLIAIQGPVNTMLIYHIMAPLEVMLLYSYMASAHRFQPITNGGILIFIVIGNVTNTLFFQPVNEFNSTAWTVNTLLLIGLALYSLFQLFSQVDTLELEKSPAFIVLTALLIYFSGSLFLYIVSSKVLSREAQGFFHNAWLIHSVSDIFKSVLLTYGLWLARYR